MVSVVEQPQLKPSFAKVAASAYKPQGAKEVTPVATPQPPVAHSSAQSQKHGAGASAAGGSRVTPSESIEQTFPAEKAGAAAARTGQWASNVVQQVAFQPSPKDVESEKPRPSFNLVKSLASEDSSTQLSSSDGSAKPPSLDGKSVASAATFALDEKESLRPDDSASLRAVEEEDVVSPPDSVAAGSRVGSDTGDARAFHDQLHQIAVMGPAAQRGAPPGRFPNPHVNNTHMLYDPNQPPDAIRRSIPTAPVNGMANGLVPHNLPAIPDDKLIEALESPRDRLFVLKLEQDFIDFIKDSNENEFSLPGCNTFYRMLAHRLADYYLLGHVVDSTMTGVKITRTPYCRIPPPLSGLPMATKGSNTPPVDQPARKIMRRGEGPQSGTNTSANSEGPSKAASKASSNDGSEDGNNNANESDNKMKQLSREEREAKYREARQRIFGSAESQETETQEPTTSGEEKDISRSSSASGKKKNKKQRNYDDDGFEARSRFNVYYPQQYPMPNPNGDASAMYYGGYSAQVPNPPFSPMAPNVPQSPAFTPGYPVMMPQFPQSQYGWNGPQQYQPSNGPMAYPGYGPVQNGYDLSADFQRGMQSFQSAGVPAQVTPKMTNPPMASYQDSYPPQNMGINQWSPSGPSMGDQTYMQSSPNGRPMTTPLQPPVPGPFGYNQYPGPHYTPGKPPRNQHPLPGSFNRQQFNPQSQAFIPGSRNGSFQMQQNMNQMPHQPLNNYGNMALSMPNQASTAIPRANPPAAHQQSFGSPHGLQNHHPLPAGVNNTVNPQPTQGASSQPGPSPAHPQPVGQANSAQSSIAKYGTPAHLPPKPPPPAQPQAPKLGLPGHNFPPMSRQPNGMPSAFTNNVQVLRGGAVAGTPSKPS